MLNIALIGYGKMGKAVEAEALQRGHNITCRTDRQQGLEALRQQNQADVAIEFTHPDSVTDNLLRLIEMGIPVVTGTTGWQAQHERVAAAVEQHKGALLHSANFSPGVNMLYKLNELLARMMNAYPAYDCFVEERHHRHKADAPSGTALELGRQLLRALDRKTGLQLPGEAPQADAISMASTRAGEITGFHRISYVSEIDRIEIQHEAYTRKGFALGAVLAAEWLVGKSGIFTFQDVLEGG